MFLVCVPVVGVSWANRQPPRQLGALHPLLLTLSFAIAFSRTTIAAIVAHMSKEPMPAIVHPAAAVFAAIFLTTTLVPSAEATLLPIHAAAAGVEFLTYAFGVVSQLCGILRIHCFSLKEREA